MASRYLAGISCVGEDDQSADMTECLRWAGPVPPQIRECRVPCKDDCTLTAWSRFTDCSGCGGSHSRKRSLTGKGAYSHCEGRGCICVAAASSGDLLPKFREHLSGPLGSLIYDVVALCCAHVVTYFKYSSYTFPLQLCCCNFHHLSPTVVCQVLNWASHSL